MRKTVSKFDFLLDSLITNNAFDISHDFRQGGAVKSKFAFNRFSQMY